MDDKILNYRFTLHTFVRTTGWGVTTGRHIKTHSCQPDVKRPQQTPKHYETLLLQSILSKVSINVSTALFRVFVSGWFVLFNGDAIFFSVARLTKAVVSMVTTNWLTTITFSVCCFLTTLSFCPWWGLTFWDMLETYPRFIGNAVSLDLWTRGSSTSRDCLFWERDGRMFEVGNNPSCYIFIIIIIVLNRLNLGIWR